MNLSEVKVEAAEFVEVLKARMHAVMSDSMHAAAMMETAYNAAQREIIALKSEIEELKKKLTAEGSNG